MNSNSNDKIDVIFRRPGFEAYRRMSLEIGYLVFRNIFILINLIIFTVVALLIIFGDTREGIFLGVIITLNIILGIIQDVNAWIVLERLQLLTALRIIRIDASGIESVVTPDELIKGDMIKLKLGDQAPCDGTVVEAKSLEISESIITGESNSFPKRPGDKILAGSVITAGYGIEKVETVFHESRLAKMTARIKRYSVNLSPIQWSITRVVSYSGYVLLMSVAFVVMHGIMTGQSRIDIVRTSGALSSILVPQGLVVAVTLLFAYGGIHFYRRHVLLREVNATEKLAHIKNLCLDKTGTLTENDLTVEEILVPANIDHIDHIDHGLKADQLSFYKYAESLSLAYISGSGDSSQLIYSIRDHILGVNKDLNKDQNKSSDTMPRSGDVLGTEVVEAVSFSSWRQYGGVRVVIGTGEDAREAVVLAGTPEIFLPYFKKASDKEWLQGVIDKNGPAGKRVFCFVMVDNVSVSGDGGVPSNSDGYNSARSIPEKLSSSVNLVPLSAVILANELRPGIKKAIDFFQNRGVRLRILSGDNTETIRAVAAACGIAHPEALITGAQMESWTQEDFDKQAHNYSIFARIVPEQKEKIIDALRKDGFTAMVGDGANDALAIKKSDLGIAMFDGTPATRQIAAVVLMHNSFTELPDGVRLADSIIEKIEIYGAIFFNQTFLGFFLFVSLAALGYAFPFSPLNISFANYFTVGLPALLISYWAIRPAGETKPLASTEASTNGLEAKDSDRSNAAGNAFLKRILSFSLSSSLAGVIMSVIVHIFASKNAMVLGLKAPDMQTMIVLLFVFFGTVFFLFTPGVYGNKVHRSQRLAMLIFSSCEAAIFLIAFSIPLVRQFFDLTILPLHVIIMLIPVFALYCLVQMIIARRFHFRR